MPRDGEALRARVDFRQSNHEGELVDWFHEAKQKKAAGVVINPAGYTTTSVAILDAIYAVQLPTVEVHITNIHQREDFRHHSYISKGAKGGDLRLRRRGLCARDRRACVADRRQGTSMSRVVQFTTNSRATELSEQDLIRELAKLLDETGLTEIEVEREGLRVRVARQAVTHVVAAGGSHVPPIPASAPAPAIAIVPAGRSRPSIRASSPRRWSAPPIRSPQPGAKPFVDIGSAVKAGETLLIIEAMKTMNQIPAPRAGTVTQILFEDGQPVEFGEPLMIIVR